MFNMRNFFNILLLKTSKEEGFYQLHRNVVYRNEVFPMTEFASVQGIRSRSSSSVKSAAHEVRWITSKLGAPAIVRTGKSPAPDTSKSFAVNGAAKLHCCLTIPVAVARFGRLEHKVSWCHMPFGVPKCVCLLFLRIHGAPHGVILDVKYNFTLSCLDDQTNNKYSRSFQKMKTYHVMF
jgi:hypothetical protein